ncbi:5'-3' exonuclease [Marinibactrum halimedae]|uniref:Exodeoxyribonuclease IX n=1 Tax=Marinibactrum halimedae TaxID=1444977 RepID=A0AA37WMC8_9GAMM|nr:5'-3' exonuclease H3TH domain-containing protein [Marinibactrum halimedae]MCD9457851.1 flap endonuclease [Marinibactrum halimedae]GLS26328.1 exodeoxyribonuclease IX [Marinibactrum halimedae]
MGSTAHTPTSKHVNPTEDVFLIDASIFIFRYYFSLPPNWVGEEGFSTEAIYGFAQFLLALTREQPESLMACCFDESLETGFRHQLSEQYKSSRALPDEALAYQLQGCQHVAETMGIRCFSSTLYEADDLIGSLKADLSTYPHVNPIHILSRDKDLGQLLCSPSDTLWDYGKAEPMGMEGIKQKFGVNPEQVPDYLALVGDKSDDIAGVPGIGPKTAVALLEAFGSIHGVFTHLDQIPSLSVRGAKHLPAKLESHIEQIALSQTLARIVTDIGLIHEPEELRRSGVDEGRLHEVLQSFGISSLQKKAAHLFLENTKS